MRFPLLRALVLILAATLFAACEVGPQRSRAAFVEHANGLYHPARLVVFEQVERHMASGETRYLLIGGYPDKQVGGWRVVWANVGKVGRSEWIPIEYPNSPGERVASREEAAAVARRLRYQFEGQWATSPQ